MQGREHAHPTREAPRNRKEYANLAIDPLRVLICLILVSRTRRGVVVLALAASVNDRDFMDQ